MKIKAGWTLRFTNLSSGSTYSITEVNLPDGFTFVKAEGRYVKDTADANYKEDPQTPSANGVVVSGTINVPNTEFYVDYTNKYEETSITVTKIWEDNNNQDGQRPDLAEYISLLADGKATDPATKYDENRTITLDENDPNKNTYIITYSNLPKYVDGEEVEYKVSESAIPNYTTTGSPAAHGETITNTREVGKLTISKEVTSDNDAGKDIAFTINITTDPSVNGEFTATGTGAPESEKVEFTNGKATVTLEDGQSITIAGLATEVTYTVAEDEESAKVDGYTLTIGGDNNTSVKLEEGGSEVTFEITNEYEQDTATLKLVKELDEDSEDVELSDDIAFTISGTPTSGATFDEVTVTYAAIKDGSYELTVPVGSYKVVEDEESAAIAGYTLTVSGDNDSAQDLAKNGEVTFTIVNKYEQDTATLKLVKELDEDSEDVELSDDIAFTISGTPTSGATFDEVTVTYAAIKDGSYELTVPVGSYKVVEDEESAAIAGYTLTVSGDNDSAQDLAKNGEVTFMIVNKYEKDMAKLKLTKEATGLQGTDVVPDTATFVISGTPTADVEFDDVTVTYADIKDGNWSVEVPVGTYTVKESGAEVIGYTLETTYSEAAEVEKDGEATLTVTNTYTRIMIEVKVTKVWSDDNDALGIRPESITVQLLKDGAAYGDPVVLKESNKWTYTWLTLPQYENGKLLEYSIKELAVEPYFAGLESIKDDLGYFEITLTNTLVWHDPPVLKKITNDKPENEDEFTFVLTPISGPEGVEMPMPEGNEKGIVKAKAGVETEFGNIYFYHEGTYVYTITEDGENPIAGYKYDKTVYTLTYVLTQEGTDLKMERTILKGEKVGEGEVVEVSAFEFTNEYTAPPIDIPVEKVWKGEVDPEKTRPKSITVVLLADGKDSGKTLVLTEETSWKGIFKELPSQDNGKKIKYTIQEVAVEYYTTTITGNMDEGFVITNICTYVPTGDDSNVLLWSASMMASMAGIGFVLKKKREEEAE